MSTTEKLIVQIFEKKQSIIDQVKQQAELFDQNLASKLLIRGIHPPSWLLNPAFHPQTSSRQLQDSRKEELISGFLLNCSRPSTSYSNVRCSRYNDPFTTAGTEEFLGGFLPKNCGSNNGLEAGDTSVAVSQGPVDHIACANSELEAGYRSSLAPPNPVSDINCAVKSHETVHSDSSPVVPLGADAIIPEVYTELHTSMESIQRSISNPRALELHNSAKATARSCSNGAKKTDVASNGILVSGLDFQLPSDDSEPLECAGSFYNTNNSCGFTESVIEKNQSKELCNDTTNTVAGRTTEPESCQHPSSVNGCLGVCAFNGVSSPLYIASSPAIQTDAGIPEVDSEPYLSLESIHRSNSRQRALELRNSAKAMTTSCSQEAKNTGVNCRGIFGSQLDFQQPNDVSESLQCSRSFNNRNNRCRVRESIIEHDSQTDKQCNNSFSGRISEPDSYHQLNSVNDSLTVDASFDIFRGSCAMQQKSVGKSGLLSDSIVEGVGVGEAKIGDFQGREEGKSVSSEGSYPRPKRLNELIKLDGSCAMLKEDCNNLSQSFDKSAQQPKQITVNQLDDTRENYEARKSEIAEFKSKETSNTLSGRITRSRSACQSVSSEGSYPNPNFLNESLKSDSSCSKFEEEDSILSQSFGKSVQHVNVNPLDETKKNLEARKAQIGEFKSKEKSTSTTHSRRITRSKSVSSEGSYLNPNCQSELLKPDSGCAKFEEGCSTLVQSRGKSIQQIINVTVNPLDEINGTCEASEAFKSKGKSSTYSGRITRSRSARLSVSSEDSYLKPSRVRDLLKAGSSCAKFNKGCNTLARSFGKSIKHPKHVTAKPLDESNVNFEARAQIGEFKSKEMSNAYSGQMTRSRSACIDSSFVNRILKLDVHCSEPSELLLAKKSIQPCKSFSTDFDSSWPQCKRRKTDDVPSNAFRNTLSQGARPHQCVHGGTSNGYIESTVDRPVNLEAVVNLEHFSLSCEQGGSQLNVERPDLRIDQNVVFHMMEASASSPKRQKKGGSSFKGTCVSLSGTSPFGDPILGQSCSSSLNNQPTGDSQSFLVEQVRLVDPASIIHDLSKHCIVNDEQDMLHSEDQPNFGQKVVFSTAEKNMEGRKSFIAASSSHCSVGYPHKPNLDLDGTDDTMSLFEGFVMSMENGQSFAVRNGTCFDKLDFSTSAVKRANVLEQLCSSSSIHTPLSQLSNACEIHYTPELHKSVPCGLLEDKYLRNTLHFDNGSGEQLMAGHTEHKSFSDPLPWAIRPYASPVGRPWERVTFRFNSGSSEKQRHFNPELTCFPIKEEGNGSTDEVVDTCHHGNNLENSSNHEPLAEIEEDFPEAPPLVSEADMHACRMSVDSVNTQINFTGTHNAVAKKLGNHCKSNRRFVKEGKENQCLSVSTNAIKRASESLQNQANKKTLSETTHKRDEGPFLEGASKHNNIVSNVSSFLPLVQQKQAIASFTGKRDVKVKALEAAEAAKHLEVKRENERKMKKEAMKLQRERLEQKRQLEKMKKNKEEKRKKMGTDMATKKRLRDEEERKEKERKRRHLDGAKRQQNEDKEILRVNKAKSQVLDERHHETKKPEMEAKKHQNMIKERIEGDYKGRPDIESSIRSLSMHDDRKNKSAVENYDGTTDCCIGKVTAALDIQNSSSISTTWREQSYELSPYQGSDNEDEDDEDEEEDGIPNRKFIPSWASVSSLAEDVHWQQKFDPDMLFPPERSCHIGESLLPRQQHPV